MRIPERIQNFRDLGGIVNREGRTVRHGLLLRSAALVQASDQDIDLLADEYRVRTVVDFRSDHEVMLSPDRDIPGAINVHLPMIDSNGNVWRDIMGDSDDGDPLEMLVKRAGLPLVQQLARDMYMDLTMKPLAQGQYAKFMRLVLDTTDGAVLWHCSQGKDRTGVGAALVLAALGCDRESIVHDYDISNMHYAGQVAGFIKNLNVTDPDAIMVIRTFVGANVDYFCQALDAMEKDYGTLYGYVRDCLGLKEEDIQILRDRYLE
ncbi:MAG: tyrosine-protein phosphatase [Bacteroidaceae bacterium]|nr:tyrosine-protein phosphatase [Bacteroidaceae bacterium]